MGKAFHVFDPVREVQSFPLPWNKAVTFSIRRAGAARCRRREHERMRLIQQKMVEHPDEFQELARLANQLTSAGSDDSNAEATMVQLRVKLSAADITMEEFFSVQRETSYEAIAKDRVVSIDGPALITDDAGTPVEMYFDDGPDEATARLLEDLFEEYPFIAEWVRDQSEELERQFQVYIGGAAKNSASSSDSKSTAATAPASPAKPSPDVPGPDVSSAVGATSES